MDESSSEKENDKKDVNCDNWYNYAVKVENLTQL